MIFNAAVIIIDLMGCMALHAISFYLQKDFWSLNVFQYLVVIEEYAENPLSQSCAEGKKT